LKRWTHGRLVNYDQPNSAEPLISNWLIQNPQRINLGRIGFWFEGNSTVTEGDLTNNSQILDLYSGSLSSKFTVFGSEVHVKTATDPSSDTISIQVKSTLIRSGQIGIFFDYPYSDVNKFDSPFVGVWNKTLLHTTSLQKNKSQAYISHHIDNTTYYTSIKWEGDAILSGPLDSTHRYVLQPRSHTDSLDVTVNYSPTLHPLFGSAKSIAIASTKWWRDYWESGAFVDLTSTSGANATELQRRVILSQYLLAVNVTSLSSLFTNE